MRRLLLASIPLVLLAAGCGDDSDTNPPATQAPEPTGAPIPTLDGRTFVSTDVTGHELVEGSGIRLAFEEGSLSANAGCNQIFGGYRLDGETLVVDTLGQTEMACEDALMEQDMWLTELLSGSPSVALTGDELVLTSADGTTVVTMLDRKVADPDRPLEGTRWMVESTIANDAVSSLPAGATAAITITDGTVEVEGACNSGSGSVQVGDGTLSFGPIASTMRACEDELMAVDDAIFATLAGEATYEIDADVLTIRNGAAGLVLRAEES